MDMRTGQRYESLEAARAAGVSDADLAYLVREPKPDLSDLGEIVHFASGPFKDRTYRRDGRGGLVRVA